MEYCVNNALRKHLFSHNLIQQNQFGFRPRHSAADLLTYLSHQWISGVNERQEVKVVALDIKGAFDRVWHNGLLAKLKVRGVTGKLLTWIGSYLSGRRIQVVVGGQSSAQRPINASVPQGSIAGPSFFLTYIDDLGDDLDSPVFLYADDGTLYRIVSTGGLEQSIEALNSDLSHINLWGSRWKVLFAPEKCKAMTISKKRPQDQAMSTSSLYLGGTELQECPELDLLGVTVQSNLSFESHLNRVTTNAGKRVNVFRQVAPYLDSRGKATVYKAHIRSVMEYAPLSWMSASETHLRSLDDIQKRASNIIGPSIHLDSLSHRRTVSGLGLLHRMHQREQPDALRALLPPKLCPARTTRSSHGTHRIKTLTGKTSGGQWSLQQYDRSALPAIIPVWNSLPSDIVGSPDSESTKAFVKRAHHHLIRRR